MVNSQNLTVGGLPNWPPRQQAGIRFLNQFFCGVRVSGGTVANLVECV